MLTRSRLLMLQSQLNTKLQTGRLVRAQIRPESEKYFEAQIMPEKTRKLS